jgi:GTP-binding protein
MNFIDKVTVSLSAGDGGKGVVSWRHEKFIDRGGPEGGDGGKGGSIIFEASRNQNTLAVFRYQKEVNADAGQPGGKRRKHGRNAKDLHVELPVGTVITRATGELLADLNEDGQTVVIAKGGRGGFGNAHFVSSTRQSPNFAEKGDAGEKFDAVLELKMIADVGLVGMPNAGKSTLLGRISNARPEIADYPFTTLKPNLGVVDIDPQNSLLFADIPGLIEGAADGKGLGHEFLRHVERTAVLVHMVDAYQNDIVGTYQIINKELAAYSPELAKRPQVVALNKVEGLSQDIIDDLMKTLKKAVPRGTKLLAISAAAGTGTDELLREVARLVYQERANEAEVVAETNNAIPILRLEETEIPYVVTKVVDAKKNISYEITGAKIMQFAGRTDVDNEEGLQRLRDIMRRLGILHELRRKGVEPGELIKIGNIEFPY